MPDLYGNRTTREKQLEAFIQGIIDGWHTNIENDEPIQGSDAVDYLCDLYRDAKKLVEG